MDRKIVVMLTVPADDDADLPNIIQLDQLESAVITPLVQALIRHNEEMDELEELTAGPPAWKDYDTDGYQFSLRPDGQGGLTVARNED